MSENHHKPSLKVSVLNEKITPDNYGDPKQYHDHLLEQYKLYAATAESISARRGLSNTFFLTLHTLIITAIGTFYENGYHPEPKGIVILPLIAFLTLCWAWWRLNTSYKQLNNAKFRVIDAFEQQLPAHPFVSAEWKMLGEGKDPSLYRELSDVENWIPAIFAGLYLLGTINVLYYS